MPKSALRFIAVSWVSLALLSCEAPQIEWMTAGGETYVNTWVSVDGKSVTCFISEGTQREILEISRAGREPSFRYGSFLFSFSRKKMKIQGGDGALLEELPLGKYMFLLRGGLYQKIPIDDAIAKRIARDYSGAGGGEVVDYLRSMGYEMLESQW